MIWHYKFWSIYVKVMGWLLPWWHKHITCRLIVSWTNFTEIWIYTKCQPFYSGLNVLTHWGWATHICVSKLTIIGSDNGLSPGRRQAIIWTNAGILIIGPLGTNFSEILIEIVTLSFKKMRLKMSSVKWRPFCLGLNVLILTVSSRHESILNPVLGNTFNSIWCWLTLINSLIDW